MIKLLKKLNRKAIIFCILSLIFTVFEVMFALAIPNHMTNITDIIQTYDSDLPKTLFVGFVKVIALITLSPKIQENWIVSFG